MTREEAYNRIDAIIAKYEIDEEYVTITSALDYDALRTARKALEPCDDAISRQAVVEHYSPYISEKECSRNLCDSCINVDCIFQSGIVRNHCDFYKCSRQACPNNQALLF